MDDLLDEFADLTDDDGFPLGDGLDADDLLPLDVLDDARLSDIWD